METQYDLDKIQAVLEGFRHLAPVSHSQKIEYIYLSHMEDEDVECGACVGAWCAYFLNLPLKKDPTLPGGPFWCFAAGAYELASILQVSRTTLENVLAKHGADEEAFGSWAWSRDPYLVLCDAAKEITGYDHNEYLRSLPVPPKGYRGHEALKAMP